MPARVSATYREIARVKQFINLRAGKKKPDFSWWPTPAQKPESTRRDLSGSGIGAVLGNDLGKLLTPEVRSLGRRNPLQRGGGATGYTSGLKPFVEPVLAIVALEDAPIFLVPLGGGPWTSRDACLAADAQGRIHEHDAVFRAFLHGACWAGGHAPWILTVEAGHEDELDSGNSSLHIGAHRYDLAETRADRNVVLGLAV